MSEFGQNWNLVSKEVYDDFQRRRALKAENKTENLRQLLEESFDAGADHMLYLEGKTDIPYLDFDAWFGVRFYHD